MQKLPSNENLAYHVARLLILIGNSGKPQKSIKQFPAIEGRTLLAKLDFFMRYPKYLRMAASILGKNIVEEDLGLNSLDEINSVETRMIRYLYGPWDSTYYLIISYMVGKGLIDPVKPGKKDVFRLTKRGYELLQKLEKDVGFSDLTHRAKTIYKLFYNYSGTGVKSFIYANFQDVVNLDIGELI
jgi:hypothetical protein